MPTMPDSHTPELITRAMALEPTTLDREKRTATVVWSTGAPVQRRDYEGQYIERLAVDGTDLERLQGANVLDSHDRFRLAGVLGVVKRAWIEKGQGLAEIEFSRRGEVDAILDDIERGIIRHISVGYTVNEWKDSTDTATGSRVRTAVKWTPHEISFVAVPADPGAHVRNLGGDPMPDDIKTGDAPTRNRAQTNAEIRSIAATANLDQAWIDSQVDADATVDQARAAAFEVMSTRGGGEIVTDAPRVSVGTSFDDPAVRAGWMGEALTVRFDPTFKPSEPARQFVGGTTLGFATEILRAFGESTAGMNASEIFARAMHVSGDFANIFGDSLGRTMRASYAAAPAGIKTVARQTSARDFRNKTRIQLGEFPTLLAVNEHGEYKSGTMAEGKETYALATYGRIFGISRKALINDDLGAFADMSRHIGQAAANFEA
jgi:phage head maturation protease